MRHMSRKGYRRELANAKRQLRDEFARCERMVMQNFEQSIENSRLRKTKRLLLCALVLMLSLFGIEKLHGQQVSDGIVLAKMMPGRDVGTKVTIAQNSPPCNVRSLSAADGFLNCIVVFDPSLENFPTGTMPSQCAHCIWVDWRTGAPWPASFTGTANVFPVSTGTGLADSVITQISGPPNGIMLGTGNPSQWCSITDQQFGPMTINCNGQGIRVDSGGFNFGNSSGNSHLFGDGSSIPLTINPGTLAHNWLRYSGNVMTFTGTTTCPTNDPDSTGGGALCLTNGGSSLAFAPAGGAFVGVPLFAGDLGGPSAASPNVVSLHLTGITDIVSHWHGGHHGGTNQVQLSDGTGASGDCPQYDILGSLTDSGAPCAGGLIVQAGEVCNGCAWVNITPCSSAALGSPCLNTINFPSSFAAKPRSVQVMGVGPSGNCGPPYLNSWSTTQVDVSYQSLDAAACTYTELDVIATQ